MLFHKLISSALSPHIADQVIDRLIEYLVGLKPIEVVRLDVTKIGTDWFYSGIKMVWEEDESGTYRPSPCEGDVHPYFLLGDGIDIEAIDSYYISKKAREVLELLKQDKNGIEKVLRGVEARNPKLHIWLQREFG